MARTGIEGSITVKVVFRTLYRLLTSNRIPIFVKEIGLSVNFLPSRITIFSCTLAYQSIKFLNLRIIVIRKFRFPKFSIPFLHIQCFSICILQNAGGICPRVCCWRRTCRCRRARTGRERGTRRCRRCWCPWHRSRSRSGGRCRRLCGRLCRRGRWRRCGCCGRYRRLCGCLCRRFSRLKSRFLCRRLCRLCSWL